MIGPDDEPLVLPDNGCFGCSPSRTDGLGIRFWRRGDRVVSEHAVPAAYQGAPGVAHGGIVATLFDEICCATAAYTFSWFVVTGELTVRYERPIPIATVLEWEAHVASAAHPRYLVIEATVRYGGERLAHATARIFRNRAMGDVPEGSA